MNEKILCSAIWFKSMSTPVHGPKNIEHGLVICGRRHHDCISTITTLTNLKMHELGRSVQGFLTDQNRFVDREEAVKIAMESGQIEESKYNEKCLYSEDIY